ncbi:MAG: RDD family protein [Acholeplasmatales bacterium]
MESNKVTSIEKEKKYEEITYETASIARRMAAYLIDGLIIIAILYIISIFLFMEIDAFVATLGTNEQDFEDLVKYEKFVRLFYKLILNIFISWILTRLVYFTLIPAIIGNGRTVGKLVTGIGVVDLNTLEEISPSKLMLREAVGRILVETILIIPGIISMIIPFFRDDSRTIRDLIAKTVVIRLDFYNLK